MFTELEKICVLPDVTIRQAVRMLNDGHQRIVLIVDDEFHLLGVVADSDVRRFILKGLSFDQPVREIMVREPVIAHLDMSDMVVLNLMQSTKCYEIPVLDGKQKIVGLKTLDMLVAESQPTTVVIMAGGLGSRLMPLTENLPKPLVMIGDKPILFVLLDQLLAAGFTNIYLTINYKADMIRDAIASVPAYAQLVRFVEETERLGTAGALSLLPETPATPFFVINADLLTKMDFKAMLNFHKMEANHITMAVREEKYQIPLGVVRLLGGRVLGVDEKPVYTYFVNAGVYVVEPTLLQLIPVMRSYDMPELINAAIDNNKQVGSFPVYEYWLDVGGHSDLKRAQSDAKSLFHT